MQTVLDSHLDDHARRLTAAWARAWRDVEAELRAAVLGKVAPGNVPVADPIDPARLRSAQRIIEDRLMALADQARAEIAVSADPVVRLGVDGQVVAARASYQDRPERDAITFHRADPQQVDAIIARTTDNVAITTARIPAEQADAVARRLNRGVAVGDNPNLVAEQIVQDCAGAFNGGLTRALNISRTEMLDAMRAGQKATDLANPGLITGWVWTAHLDSRACQACVGKHGEVHTPDEDGPNDHHSGRCARIPITASWSTLGFPGIPDPDLGAVDADAWVDGLDDAALASLLGRKGADAYRAGEFPRDRWAETRSNPGWRDSIAPARAPK